MKRALPIEINLPPRISAAECQKLIAECSAELQKATQAITVPSLKSELERILFERDEDIKYTIENWADDTHAYTPESVRVSCGCVGWPLKPCDWHAHVQEELEEVTA